MKSSVFETIKLLICELRNHRDTETNWKLFEQLVSENTEHIISSFSTRWLVSICDTYADFGNAIEKRNSFLISLFVNMIRVADTYRYVLNDKEDDSRVSLLKNQQIELYNGLVTLHLDRQDTCLNLSKRMIRLLNETPLFIQIYEVIIERLLNEKTLLTAFASLSTRPEFVFPLNATNIADNYGVI